MLWFENIILMNPHHCIDILYYLIAHVDYVRHWMINQKGTDVYYLYHRPVRGQSYAQFKYPMHA